MSQSQLVVYMDNLTGRRKMVKKTWAKNGWNPIIGCEKISPGCRLCYAHTMALSFQRRGFAGWEQGFDFRVMEERIDWPRTKWKYPRYIFVNSMSDLFQNNVDDDLLARLFDSMDANDRHTYLILTKRPWKMAAWINARYPNGCPDHYWLGVTVENQDYVWRAEMLAKVKAKYKTINCEPLLGPVEFSSTVLDTMSHIGVGGECGKDAVRMHPEWARQVLFQCKNGRDIPFSFHTWGEYAEDGEFVGKRESGRELDGREWSESLREDG